MLSKRLHIVVATHCGKTALLSSCMDTVLCRISSPCRWVDLDLTVGTSGVILWEIFHDKVAVLVRRLGTKVPEWRRTIWPMPLNHGRAAVKALRFFAEAISGENALHKPPLCWQGSKCIPFGGCSPPVYHIHVEGNGSSEPTCSGAKLWDQVPNWGHFGLKPRIASHQEPTSNQNVI